MSPLALFVSFEYIWHGSTAIVNVFILIVQGLTLDVRNLTSTDARNEVDPSTVREIRLLLY